MTKDWRERFENEITKSELFDVDGNDLTSYIEAFIEAERKQAQEEIVRELWGMRVVYETMDTGSAVKALVERHDLSLSDDKKV